MSKFDYLGLDGNTLRTFLTVLEELSVSRAAARLDVSQSAVSHTLEKLRIIFEDPLFVRAGRGIESTARARELGPSVETVLDDLKALTNHREFDPKTEQMEFTIAANDFPIQLIFPALLKELSEEGIHPKIRFIPAEIPNVSILRASRYRMLITPTPPDDPDLKMVSLVRSKMEIFYDAKVRTPPKLRQDITDSRYVEVRFSDTERSSMALPSLDLTTMNLPVISVPNFSLLTSMIKGTDRITLQLGVMKLGLLQELDTAPLPYDTDKLDLFLIWHRREHDDPAHRWLREKILETVNSIVEN